MNSLLPANHSSHSFFKSAFSANLLFALLISVMSLPAHSEAKQWSERKFDRTILSIDKDITRKRWSSVIKRSQKALPQCIALYSEQSPTCILVLKNINQSYEKIRTFNPQSGQIKTAYRLSSEILGETHTTTISARDYYYKYLIFNEKYAAAIPLLMEIISFEKSHDNDEYQLMERYKQLYALEGLTENWPAEEAALLMVIRLAQEVLGKDSEDFTAGVEALAYNYCVQKKYYEYFQLIKEQQIEISCLSENRN